MSHINLDQSQRQRLERERAALVQQLARINRMLRQRTPERKGDDWDFDPRSAANQNKAAQ